MEEHVHQPHTAGDTEAALELHGRLAGFALSQPVLTSLLAIEGFAIGGLVASFMTGRTATARIALAGTALAAAGTLIAARNVVTPVIRPQLDDDTPLGPQPIWQGETAPASNGHQVVTEASR